MRTVVAWILTQIVELLASMCVLHDKAVAAIVAAHPGMKKHLKNRVFEIKGRREGKDTVYMMRYVLFATKAVRLYAHRFLRSDNHDEFHDHPWSAAFLQLRNTYTEEFLDPGLPTVHPARLGHGWFRIVTSQRKLLEITTIRPDHTHRVSLDREYHDDPRNAPLTLALCGDRSKTPEGEDDWGFWVAQETRGHWVWRKRIHWMKYLEDSKPSH